MSELDTILKAIKSELNARLPYKRQKVGAAGQSKRSSWSSGEISTLIYGVLRLGEKEFGDLMN